MLGSIDTTFAYPNISAYVFELWVISIFWGGNGISSTWFVLTGLKALRKKYFIMLSGLHLYYIGITHGNYFITILVSVGVGIEIVGI